MIPTKKVIEPNFEGEEMKMPTIGNNRPNFPSAPSSSALSIPILILLFLILVSILGGLVYWYLLVTKPTEQAVTERPTAEQNNEPESTTAEARTETADVVSTSDELGAIKADLSSTNLSELDSEINPIKAEMNAALQAQ